MGRHFILLWLVLVGMGLTSCTPVSPPIQDTAVTPAPVLRETTPLTDSGFAISYPAGWVVRTNGSTTMIEEHANACDLHDGVCVVHDHLSIAMLSEMGLPEPVSLRGMLELNRRFFTWKELAEPEETEVFDVPALGVRYYDDGVHGYILMGFLEYEGFLLNIAAPTESGLDEILPTFTAMRASIEKE